MAEPLEELARHVADRDDVDWDDAARSAQTDEERHVVANLRLVESVVRVHTSQRIAELSAAELERMTASFGEPHAAAGADSDAPAPLPAQWGKLHVLDQVDEGAFGAVYRVWDPDLQQEAALKLLKVEGPDEAKLLREARLLARVRHPNVVTLYGVEEHGGRIGLRMELVRGTSLADLLAERGTLGAQEAAVLGADLCRALAAVHAVGLVHRDVKPRNVMRAEGGRIVLMDFGSVRDVGPDSRDMLGTPLYIAPEVCLGAPPTARSDVYSLGVLLYHLVTGSYPVRGGSFDALRDAHAARQTRLLRDARPDLPQGFVKAVERALAWDPADRFATAGQMEQALTAVLGAELDSALPPKWGRRAWVFAAAAAFALSLLGYASFEWLRPPSYTVHAALYRTGADGRRERVDPGARLAVGDALSLEFKASHDVYLYVVSEDALGHAFALFPLSTLDTQNPLAGGIEHAVPGTRRGEHLEWLVNTAGGRERLLLLASPERLAEYEAAMNRLDQAGSTTLALPIPDDAFRGIGGLGAPPASSGGGSAGPLFEMAERLASGEEEVSGMWLRRIELDNPVPVAGGS